MIKRVLSVLLAALMLLLPATAVVAAGSSGLQVEEAHFIISPGNTGLTITEFLAFNNADSKPFGGGTVTDPSGKKRTAWSIPLPGGYQNLQMNGLENTDYAGAADGIQVFKAIAPGKSTFSLSYTLPVSSLPAAISKKIPFTTQQFFVIAPVNAFSVKADALKDEGTVNFNNNTYEQLWGGNLAAGTVVNITVDQAQAQAAPANDQLAKGFDVKLHPAGHVKLFMSEPLVYTNPHLWAAYIFIMLGLGIAAAILWYRGRFGHEDEEPQTDSNAVDEQLFLRLNAKHDLLLQHIKSLDDRFAAGAISDQVYKESREKYKQLLVQVKLQLRELT